MAFGYHKAMDIQQGHINTLRAVIAAQMIVIVALWFGWQSAPRDLTVHLPPDLRDGVSLKAGEVPPQSVYTFAQYIFQQLNRWEKDGQKEAGGRLYALAPYLTPAYQQQIQKELDIKGRSGEMAGRTRGITGIPGHDYTPARVRLIAPGVWEVTMDMELMETVDGMVVKRAQAVYPIRVVRYDIDREKNPWGLALDGYAGNGPHRLDNPAKELSK